MARWYGNQVVISFYFTVNSMRLSCSISLQKLGMVSPFNFNYSSGCVAVSHGFNLYSFNNYFCWASPRAYLPSGSLFVGYLECVGILLSHFFTGSFYLFLIIQGRVLISFIDCVNCFWFHWISLFFCFLFTLFLLLFLLFLIFCLFGA